MQQIIAKQKITGKQQQSSAIPPPAAATLALP